MSRAEQIGNYVAWLNARGDAMEALIAPALDQGADEFVSLAQSVCPDSELDEHPGQLRESIHKEDGSDPLKRKIVADASRPGKDGEPNYYGVHVEVGHKTPDGKHVPPHPFWWPSWRLTKRAAKSRIYQAVLQATKGGS